MPGTVATAMHRVRGGLDHRSRSLPPARRLRFALVQRALDRCVRSQHARILDAGAGEGLLAEAVARRRPGWAVLAADIDRAMLGRGEARLRAAGVGNVTFQVADLMGDLGAERFDAVLAVECLTEIPDDRAALHAMARALRPGGTLLLHVPTHDWRPALPGSEASWRYEVRHGYTPEALRRLVSEAGLEVLRIDPVARTTGGVAQEVADRLKDTGLLPRVLALPVLVAAVTLEDLGVTWGPPRALFVEARRP